jgi:hypothetical protein
MPAASDCRLNDVIGRQELHRLSYKFTVQGLEPSNPAPPPRRHADSDQVPARWRDRGRTALERLSLRGDLNGPEGDAAGTWGCQPTDQPVNVRTGQSELGMAVAGRDGHTWPARTWNGRGYAPKRMPHLVSLAVVGRCSTGTAVFLSYTAAPPRPRSGPASASNDGARAGTRNMGRPRTSRATS